MPKGKPYPQKKGLKSGEKKDKDDKVKKTPKGKRRGAMRVAV